MLLEPLPSTDEDESPSPTPSELPRYFWNKVSESRKPTSKSSKLSKGLTTSTPRRIPPSGTPVKLEASTSSTRISIKHESDALKPSKSSKSKLKTDLDSKSKSKSKSNVKPDPNKSSASSGSESDLDPGSGQGIEETIQIAHLKIRFLEFTYLFPAFPKTHPNGYAYIIDLSHEVLNEQALIVLRDALQYSLTGGGGARVLDNVKFFAVDDGEDGEKVPMKIHYRVCAGISTNTNLC